MKVLLVDAMPVVYANFSKVGHLSTSSGEPTGLRYGFLRTVRSYKERTDADRVVIAWDTQAPIFKAANIDLAGLDYKGGRSTVVEQGIDGKVDKKVMFDQIPALKEMLSLTAWSQVWEDGYEADDLLGQLAYQLEGSNHHPVIYSPDNDLCQVVTEKTSIFVPKTKNEKRDWYKDETWVRGKYGVPPKHIPIYRALMGDPSDNLEGVSRYITASKSSLQSAILEVLNSMGPEGTLADFMWALEISDKEIFNQLMAVRERLEANHQMMRLHFPPQRQVLKGAKSEPHLNNLFQKLEFNSMFKFIPDLIA